MSLKGANTTTPTAPGAMLYGLKNDSGVFPIEQIIAAPADPTELAEDSSVEEPGEDAIAEEPGTMSPGIAEQDAIIEGVLEEAESDDDSDLIEEGEKETQSAARLVSFVDGQKKVDVSFDAKTKIPFDGGEIEVSFGDLQKAYNGKGFYEKKITEVGKKEKEVSEKEASLDRKKKEFEEGDVFLTEVANKANNGDPYGALALIFDHAGLNSGNLLRNYILQANKTVKQIAEKGYTADQLESIIAKKSLEFEKSRTDAKSVQLESKSKEITYNELKTKALKDHGYTEDQYTHVAEDLEKIGIKLSELSPDERVEKVVSQIRDFHIPYNKVVEVAKKNLSKDDFKAVIDDSNLVESLLVLARTASSEKLLKALKTLYTPGNEVSSTTRDSSKKADDGRATSEKSAPRSTKEEPKYEGVFITMDDVVAALS